MRMFKFNAPQERVGPRFFTSEQDFTNVNAGRFVRNAVLDGLTYGSSDLAPAWLKTRDAIHPFFGYLDQIGESSSVFGGCGASADADNARAILNPQNTAIWWAPGGDGADSWIYAKLPEATLVETYDVGSKYDACPLSWKLQGSNDGEAWADLHIVDNTGVWDAAYECKTFTVPETSRGNYLYYRLYIVSSNQSAMKIRSLRLFRAASVCAKGQLLLEASAENPLVLSFANGFAADGVTPVDNDESMTASLLKTMFDASGYSIIHNAPITAPVPVNIYAVRNNGVVELEMEDASGELFVQANGGMTGVSDKGWLCSNSAANALNIFGRVGNLTGYGNRDTSVDITYTKADVTCGVYAKSIYARIYGNSYVTWYLYAIELDNSETRIAGGNAVGIAGYINIDRRIRGVRLWYRNSLGGGNSSGYITSIAVISPSAPAYRFTNGRLYSREAPGDSWVECQKIKIGSVVLDPSGEVFQPLAFSALQLQLMTNGSAESYLGA